LNKPPNSNTPPQQSQQKTNEQNKGFGNQNQQSKPFNQQGNQPFNQQGNQPFNQQGNQPFNQQGNQPFNQQGNQSFFQQSGPRENKFGNRGFQSNMMNRGGPRTLEVCFYNNIHVFLKRVLQKDCK